MGQGALLFVRPEAIEIGRSAGELPQSDPAFSATVHSVLFVVLRMEDFALLAGTGALFAALAAVMFFTRNIDWHAQDAPTSTAPLPEATP